MGEITPSGYLLLEAYKRILLDPMKDLQIPHDNIRLLITQPDVAGVEEVDDYMKLVEPSNGMAMEDFNQLWLHAIHDRNCEIRITVPGRPDEIVDISEVKKEGNRLRKDMMTLLGVIAKELNMPLSFKQTITPG